MTSFATQVIDFGLAVWRCDFKALLTPRAALA